MDEYDYADPGDPAGSYGEEYDNQAELEELLNGDEDPDIKIGSYLGDNMDYFEKLAEDAEMLEALDDAGALDGDEIDTLADEAGVDVDVDDDAGEDIDIDSIDPDVLESLDEDDLAEVIDDEDIDAEDIDDMSGEEIADLLEDEDEDVDEEALAELLADVDDGSDDDSDIEDLAVMEADEEEPDAAMEEVAEDEALEKQSSFHYDILGKAYAKTAGFADMMNGLLGNNGTVNTPLMALGGAGLGAMAGHGLGHGALGTLGGALLGGALGGIGSNAINSQNDYQNVADMAMLNNVNSSLNANMQSDMAQNQAIMQTNETVGQLVDAVNNLVAQQQGMGGGMPPMDPAMMGGQPPMDPAMMGGAPQGGPGMMPPPPPPPAGPANNGLGPKQGSYRGDPIANLLRRFRTGGY